MSRPVYTEHVYNIRVNSFYYLKWRHLVNRLPLDNAMLKHQHEGVGRRLVHRQDECCVCGTGGQGQQSVLLVRRFLVTGYCQMRSLVYQKHCLRECVNFIELNIQPPNNPNMNQVNRAVWGNTPEDGFTMQ